MKTMGIFNQIHVNVTLDLQDVKFDDGLPVNIWVKCGLEPLPLLRGNRLFEEKARLIVHSTLFITAFF